MPRQAKHIAALLMLGLVLLYSTPIKSLHDCRNLEHKHSGVVFEETHPTCYLCDLQTCPFTETQTDSGIEHRISYPAFDCSYSSNYYKLFSNAYLNKGPPAQACQEA